MGHHSCCNKQKVKRGLWSPEEDEKLINYISSYGHGCWSSVPRLAGLQRCGKSCRLRWINYLRPDLKRGSFSPQEAALIIELHRILGNRWAQIAKHLPGRTDNEVKNFWNSSIKKKLLSHGVPDLATFPDIPNPNASPEAFFSLNGNPNLIPSPQDHQLYLPSPTSMLQSGFDQANCNLEFAHFQPPPAPPLSDPSSYVPTWPLGYHPHLIQEDYVLGNELAPMMPKLSETINRNDRIVPSSSFPHEVVDPVARLPSFPSGSHPHAPHVPISHFDYIEAIISSLPS
ncbi:hypothetical protein PVL29_011208 [Vitis rotundifolia]|uniref:Uncharacterized protein n=1 Tax=Vitis rotundifolia TaxID=103349 RepID=A0AA38ZMU8_VITRO|nr:hypothetical protein PVL29_011208 [Vitis rotundifolia]